MAGFVRRRFADILDRMKTWVTTYCTTLTDFNQGGALMTTLQAVSWVIDDLYEDLFLGFREMIRLFIYRLFRFDSKGAVAAGTTIRFSRNVVGGTDVVIPIGTIAETTDGVQFATDASATILAAALTSNVVAASAVAAGVSGNVLINTVTRMVTDVANVDAVTNTVAATGGQDSEADGDKQIRFQKYVTNLARSTRYGLEAGAETVTGCFQAQAVEHPTTRGYIYLYLDSGTGSATAALIAAVQLVVEGNGTDTNPGYRGAGTFVDYQSASATLVSVTQTLWVRSGADHTVTKDAVEAAQRTWIGKHRLGNDLVKEQLEKVALENRDVIDILITLPASNVIVAAGKVAKPSTFTTTVLDWVDA